MLDGVDPLYFEKSGTTETQQGLLVERGSRRLPDCSCKDVRESVCFTPYIRVIGISSKEMNYDGGARTDMLQQCPSALVIPSLFC